ncbi:MAG: hypothetical protein KGD59_11255 [Candidatus Heimdallarchaeota archaeon]|nr:hypothetical protein [Candidatus Heimdallarchaeota archaeon]MBY8995119.1 hypothetical protein [Candidatus Heimdallarchaeota archaeon]
MFAFSTLDSTADKDIYKREYYVVTGSVNPKRYAYTERGNNQIVIREPFEDHPIYDAFKDCFYDAYNLEFG